MSNEHEWENDWARYFAVDENGKGHEYSVMPCMCLSCWGVDVTTANDAGYSVDIAKSSHSYTGSWTNSLQQRYTKQQRDLLALDEGWIVGEWKGAVDKLIKGEAVLLSGDRRGLEQVAYWDGVGKGTAVVAYRLHNGKGYKDGAKEDAHTPEPCEDAPSCKLIELAPYYVDLSNQTNIDYLAFYNKIPPENFDQSFVSIAVAAEWVDGLPPAGEVCKVFAKGRWVKCSIVGRDNEGNTVAKLDGYHNEYVGNDSCSNFRPIQSERDKVIDLILQHCIRQYRHNDNSDGFVFGYELDGVKELLRNMHDTGCLKLPEGK